MHLFLVALSLFLPLVGVYFYGLVNHTNSEQDFFIWFYIFIAQFILSYIFVERIMYKANVVDCDSKIEELDSWLDKAIDGLDSYDVELNKEKMAFEEKVEELNQKLQNSEDIIEKERQEVSEMKED